MDERNCNSKVRITRFGYVSSNLTFSFSDICDSINLQDSQLLDSWFVVQVTTRLLAILAIILLISASTGNFDRMFPNVSQDSSVSLSQSPEYRIVEHPLPAGSSRPLGLSADKLGRIWFVAVQSNQIGMFNPASNSFSEFNVPTPNSLLEQIAIDNSGNAWFTELTPNQLGELKNGTETILEFEIPKGQQGLPCGPIGVTTSLDGNVWITCEFSNQIDEFFPINETFSAFDIPVFHSAPLQIVFDQRGNLWFTAADADMLGYAAIAQLKNETSDGIQEFSPMNQTYLTTITLLKSPPIQSAISFQQSTTQVVTSILTPTGLSISPDGTILWITEHSASSFDRYNIQSKTLVKYWTSQTHNVQYTTSLPNGIAVDERGYVWIAEHYGNKIAEFNPLTEQLVEYPIPCCKQGIAGSLYLTLGMNGTVWFSEFFGNAIGEMRPTQLEASLWLSVGMSTASMDAYGNISLPITLILKGSKETTSPSVYFDISGISVTGSPENLEASFNPSNLTLSHEGNGNASLILKSNGIEAGIYYLTVSAKLSSTGVTYSTILKLAVQGTSASRTLLLYGGVIGVTILISVVASFFLFTRKTRYRRFERKKR